ncbi:MAG TPA: head GIN domain-containing protein, partial [Ferruginibacter sp.]|nr:head GIN domain-containing protein [Ferruginibacter sp.]
KLFCSLVILLALTAFAQDKNVINDPNATVRTVNGSFTAISVSSGIELYMTQGNEESVAVSASDQKHLDRIKTEVENGTLKIYYNNKGITWKSDNRHLKAYVSFKTLSKLTASAGSEVNVNGSISSDNLDMRVSSGAEFTGAINAKQFTVDVSSGAEVKISGRSDKLSIEVSSGAEFDGYGLTTDYCDASASSGASVEVTINKELNAKASGGADIRYKGEALIRDIKMSGGGAVGKRS